MTDGEEASLQAETRKPEPLFQYDRGIIHLWQCGLDTFEIAAAELRLHQSVVANRLARLRDAGAM
jgi:DNA-binding Lrp family transcriptional regulator